MPAWGFASRAARTKTAKHTRESLIPPPRVISVTAVAASVHALSRGFSSKFTHILFSTRFSPTYTPSPLLDILDLLNLLNSKIYFFEKDWERRVIGWFYSIRSSITSTYIFWSFMHMYILAYICNRFMFAETVMRGIELYYALPGEVCRLKRCLFLPDLPLRWWLFNAANHRGSQRDLPSLRRRSRPTARLGLSFFSPRCLDTSTYVYARERMRANNGPACIWNSINSPNISSSSEINLIVPRWKWWHHY